MKLTVTRTCRIEETPRVLQMRGIFDVQPSAESTETWGIDIPAIDNEGDPVIGPHGPWSVGLITGPSGSGKSSVGREFFGAKMLTGFDWHPSKSVLDGFPVGMGIKEITGLMSSVGFSSPPAWLRPFHVLSQGQQFRVTVARALAEMPDMAVIDEWTSVVDRTVAQIGSAAVAKAVRRSGKRLVAITCHYDVADWLQPDWILDMADGSFQWRSVQPRPRIDLTIQRVHHRAWELFKKHHYMNGEHLTSAHCYVGFVRGAPVAFLSVASFPHPTNPGWSFHRSVVLPDYQGCGVGVVMADTIAAIYAAIGKPVRAVTAHPALKVHHAKSPLWDFQPEQYDRLSRGMSVRKGGGVKGPRPGTSPAGAGRYPASFRWVGPADVEAAMGFGLPIGVTR